MNAVSPDHQRNKESPTTPVTKEEATRHQGVPDHRQNKSPTMPVTE